MQTLTKTKLFRIDTQVKVVGKPVPSSFRDWYEYQTIAEALAVYDEEVHRYGVSGNEFEAVIVECDDETQQPIASPLRRVLFTLCDSGPVVGLTDDSLWNGWLNVLVTAQEHAKLVAKMRVSFGDFGTLAVGDSGLASLKPGIDGLISLNGYCTEEHKEGK